MRATFGCGTPRAAAGARSAILFIAQADVASTATLTAEFEGKIVTLAIVVALQADRVEPDFAIRLVKGVPYQKRCKSGAVWRCRHSYMLPRSSHGFQGPVLTAISPCREIAASSRTPRWGDCGGSNKAPLKAGPSATAFGAPGLDMALFEPPS